MSVEMNLQQWIENRFEGLTAAELREAGKVLDVSFGPNTSEATMRTKLVEKLGELPAEGLQTSAAPKSEASPRGRWPFETRLNLMPGRDWEGLCHVVRVNAPSDNTDTPKSVLGLVWEGISKIWPYNMPIFLPEPYWHALNDAVKTDLDTQDEYEPGTSKLKGTKRVETKFHRYNFHYIGIKPGTEHLPKSALEYWQRQCEKTDGFSASKGVERKHLILIHSELYGPPGLEVGGARSFYKDMTNEDIMIRLYDFLGYDEYADGTAQAA